MYPGTAEGFLQVPHWFHCFENGWDWGKNALPVRNSCVGFPMLSVVTYVIEVFAQLPAELQVFPASFVFLDEAVCGCSVRFPPSLRSRGTCGLHYTGKDVWAWSSGVCWNQHGLLLSYLLACLPSQASFSPAISWIGSSNPSVW